MEYLEYFGVTSEIWHYFLVAEFQQLNNGGIVGNNSSKSKITLEDCFSTYRNY